MKRIFQTWELSTDTVLWTGSSKRLARKQAKRQSFLRRSCVCVRYNKSTRRWPVFAAGCAFENGSKDPLDWVVAEQQQEYRNS